MQRQRGVTDRNVDIGEAPRLEEPLQIVARTFVMLHELARALVLLNGLRETGDELGFESDCA